jgi:malate dehydrogenase (oxaloacetate-decarboxylating)
LTNALRVTGRELKDAKIVLLGAGAANSTAARLILKDGGDPDKMVVFDSKGGLHAGREDVKADTAYYRKWEICEATNPKRIDTIEEALRGADVIIAASKPGPDTIKPGWIRSMGEKSIVFACANPVPEVYPYAAKEAGAYVVATGRGDFPNQVNNSIGFPGILKGALLVRARKITDEMAIAAAHSVANFVVDKNLLSPDHIMPTMEDTEVFAVEAAEVAMQAIKDGVARVQLTWQEVYDTTLADIKEARAMINVLQEKGFIESPGQKMLEDARDKAVTAVRG